MQYIASKQIAPFRPLPSKMAKCIAALVLALSAAGQFHLFSLPLPAPIVQADPRNMMPHRLTRIVVAILGAPGPRA